MKICESRICNSPNCSHSGESQPITNFYKNKLHTIGISYECKDCNKKRKKDLRDLEGLPIYINRAIELSKVKSNHSNRNNEKIRRLAIRIFKIGITQWEYK